MTHGSSEAVLYKWIAEISSQPPPPGITLHTPSFSAHRGPIGVVHKAWEGAAPANPLSRGHQPVLEAAVSGDGRVWRITRSHGPSESCCAYNSTHRSPQWACCGPGGGPRLQHDETRICVKYALGTDMGLSDIPHHKFPANPRARLFGQNPKIVSRYSQLLCDDRYTRQV